MKKTLLILATVLSQLNSFAQYTTIPDANFENALINLGYDNGATDGKVLTANINTITSLNVSSESISDLTGIQDFVAIKDLNCSSNQLTSLNVNGLKSLTFLGCDSNNLTSLNASGLKSLTFLGCYFNQLTSLNLSGCAALEQLECSGNQLTSIDVSGCKALTILYCISNQLTSLNVTGLTALTTLNCVDNKLISLNVSGLVALTYLACIENQLTSLNLKGLTALTSMSCYFNPPLSCIQVDNIAAAVAKSDWRKPATATYSLNCGLATNTYKVSKDIAVFPNPTQNSLTLSTATTINKIIITDLTGKTVLHQTLTSNQVNVQNLAKGMYILQAYRGKQKYIEVSLLRSK